MELLKKLDKLSVTARTCLCPLLRRISPLLIHSSCIGPLMTMIQGDFTSDLTSEITGTQESVTQQERETAEKILKANSLMHSSL